jgi:hypothetical protein
METMCAVWLLTWSIDRASGHQASDKESVNIDKSHGIGDAI